MPTLRIGRFLCHMKIFLKWFLNQLIYLCNISSRSDISAESGLASGPGIGILVEQAANDFLFKESHAYWTPGTKDFMTLNVALPPFDYRVLKCRLLGALTAYIICHSGALPVRLSPAFLHAVIKGASTIDDLIFICSFSPVMGDILTRYWPVGGRPQLPTDDTSTAAEVLRYVLDEMQIEEGDISHLSIGYCNWARETFIHYRLFGGTVHAPFRFDDNDLVKAFVRGMDIPLNQVGDVTFLKVHVTLLSRGSPIVSTKILQLRLWAKL
ncbi:hypothetical protein PM082_009155 [Marasmius tenuissimus]|nr:hypothetical protein PM082_009155 [Marasmius tenuissimus]